MATGSKRQGVAFAIPIPCVINDNVIGSQECTHSVLIQAGHTRSPPFATPTVMTQGVFTLFLRVRRSYFRCTVRREGRRGASTTRTSQQHRARKYDTPTQIMIQLITEGGSAADALTLQMGTLD
ncbi:MAG TPA: hypothetical protein PLD41_17685, partial [Casimicrobium huifangae]|nr:hypothetical protein [Casimicrobium huifangae]